MSKLLEMFISEVTFPSSFNMFFALRVSQLCRICLTFALVKDKKQFFLLIFFENVISTVTELVLACNKHANSKPHECECPSTPAKPDWERTDPPTSSLENRNFSWHSPVRRSSAQNSTARSVSTKSRKSRSRLSSKRSFPPFLGSRTDSRISAAGPLERFLSLQDFQRQADIGRLIGEELLRDDWEKELLMEPGHNRIGMKIRKPNSRQAKCGSETSSRRTYVSSYTI
ncbi:hypothetical protein TWF102_005093 [Orbilia oligospora]|uniref:Uncharacterized protein n=1 Tax=Orbilia oligospora TaxID=2813651 RepID=A0A7C8N8Y9_ORBOL|nr:hypothetical protein TWF103_006648 [Orbilia oligospora]KAF3100712.1 hypothetical protein TWF102_005093 [Orbilia oligospora]